MKTKIEKFTQLVSWQKSHELVLAIYKITKDFPIDERFALVQQIRRCVVSISSNIAEGFVRASYVEKIRFYNISLSSVAELQNQILISKDVSYITKQDFFNIANKTVEVRKLIIGLIRGARLRI